MKIAFHGAARTVTGSKHLLTLINGKKVLLDCGMFQGMGDQTDALNRDFGFDPFLVDAMILSHAHIDHCGLIPKFPQIAFDPCIGGASLPLHFAHRISHMPCLTPAGAPLGSM